MRTLSGFLVSFLTLSACTALAPGGSRAAHEAPMAAPAERIYLVLHEVYPSLGIPIARADDAALTVTSGPLPPRAEATGAAYYRCTPDPSFGPVPGQQTSAQVVTRILAGEGVARVQSRLTAEIVGATRDGGIRRLQCASTGVLEERILRALEARL